MSNSGRTPLSVVMAQCPVCGVYSALPEGMHLDGDLIGADCEACGAPFVATLAVRTFPEDIGHLIEMAMLRGEWVAE